jgi:thiol-disulfide isomerase/thioredoxin
MTCQMTHRRIFAPLLICAGLLVSGCDTSSTAPSSSGPPSSGPPASTAPASDGASPATNAKQGSVDVTIQDFDGIQALIASKRDRVVVMDCWSTYCPPCMKEFHNLVELHQEYPEQVACVSLNFDYTGGKGAAPDDSREAVLDFLTEKGATFDNVIASVPAEDLYQQMDFKTAAVPAVFVYDREGKLAKQFEGEVSYADVRQLVAELLGNVGAK